MGLNEKINKSRLMKYKEKQDEDITSLRNKE